MQVSVIIVNYNTKKLTSECIDSVFEKTKDVEFEVILVDNASTDGSVEHFSNDKRIKFIASPENLGFGRANNKGLEVATGKYIFYLNSDTLLANNAIKLFYDKMEASPEEIACMGTLLWDKEGKVTHSFGRFPTVRAALLYATPIYWLPRHLGFKSRIYDDPKYVKGHFFQVPYVTGADMFVRRSVIDKYGAFDPDFFMYYEDPDMQLRHFKHGYVSYIYDAPHIHHLRGASSKKSPTMKARMISLRSIYTYHKKHASKFAYAMLRILFPLFSSIHLLHPKRSWSDKAGYLKATIFMRVEIVAYGG